MKHPIALMPSTFKAPWRVNDTPMALSIRMLKFEGSPIVDVCERFVFGIFDLMCVRCDVQGAVGVQTTTRENYKSRLNTIKEAETTASWLAAGNLIEVHGWYVGGPASKKEWRLHREVLGHASAAPDTPVLLELLFWCEGKLAVLEDLVEHDDRFRGCLRQIRKALQIDSNPRLAKIGKFR